MNENQFKTFKEEFKQELLESFNDALNAGRSIDDETHRDHHEFVKVMIDKEKRSIDRSEKIKATVIGWFIITVLGGVGTAVYHVFIKAAHP